MGDGFGFAVFSMGDEMAADVPKGVTERAEIGHVRKAP